MDSGRSTPESKSEQSHATKRVYVTPVLSIETETEVILKTINNPVETIGNNAGPPS